MADYSATFEAAGKAHNVDPALLRAVMYRGEMSNGDPHAVSPKGATGLMQLMPATAKEMGVTDISDPTQNIFGGAKYLSQHLDKYKSVPLALAAYNAGPGAVDKAGGIPNFPETQAYVKRTMGAYQGQNMPKADSDPFLDMVSEVRSGKSTPAATQPSAGAATPNDSFLAMVDSVRADKAPATETPKPATQPKQPLSLADKTLAIPAGIYHGFQGVTDSAMQGGAWLADKALGTNYKPGIDAIVNQHNEDFNAKYGGNDLVSRVAQNANVGGQMAATAPILSIKALKGAGVVRDFVNGAVQGGVAGAATSSQSDTPLWQQVATGAGMGGAGNVLIPRVGRALSAGVDAIENSASPVVNSLAEKMGFVRAQPTAIPPGSIPFGPSGEALTPRGKPLGTIPKPNYRPNGDGTFREAPPASSTVPPTTQAKPGTSQPAVPTFEAPELPKPKTKLSVAEQQANIDTMREIGLGPQRQSAYTGDKFTAGQEYQHSKLDSPLGEVTREQLQQEQGAIKNYASGIVKDTGATAASPEVVGQSVRAPLQGLSEHYDNAITQLYKTADERAAGAANVQPNSLNTLLKNPDFRETLLAQDKQGLLGAVERQLQRFQGLLPDGAEAPNTVKSAESFRQWLNKQWTPDNSATIGQLKEALDTDVAKAGGEDIYAAARALHAERKNTLDNPKGIASLLNESGPNGVNKAVPDEKVGTKVITMPTAQFEHVVNTLKSLPDSLQPQGAAALSEIKGELAKKIYAAGDSGGTQNGPSAWNAANVTRELNKQASKMALVFTPEEMARFQTLNRGGHLLQTPSAYPGAAVQGHNLLQRGMIWAPPAAGAALGHAIGGYPGMALGTTAGSALSAKMAKAADMANANKLRSIMNNPQPVK